MTAISSLPDFASAPIAVIGLGYVGLPLAVEFGRLRDVTGFDINQERIAAWLDANLPDGVKRLRPQHAV